MREIDKDVQEAFIKEVNEDLKNEEFKKIWDKYGLYIIVLVVVALTAAVSFETIKSWYDKRMQTWSDTYAYAVSMHNQGRYDDSLESLNYIIAKDYGIFTELAQMQKINILLDQEKTDEAVKLMEEIVADKSFNRQLQQTVIFKLASYKMENSPLEDVEALIGKFARNENDSWQPVASEMLAIAYLHNNKIEEAKKIYNDLLKNDKASEIMKARISDILSVLPQ